MEQSNQVLWKRAWRLPNGDVHSTMPYLSKEELLKAEPAEGSHGNEWCGEPFSYVGSVCTEITKQVCGG